MSDIGTTGNIGHGINIVFDGDTYYVNTVKPPGFSVDAVETTHSGSTNAHKLFIPGLVDAGEVTCECLYDHSTRPTPRVVATLTVNYPGGGSDSVEAFISKLDPSAPVGDKQSANITWKLSGEVSAS